MPHPGKSSWDDKESYYMQKLKLHDVGTGKDELPGPIYEGYKPDALDVKKASEHYWVNSI
jgi:hypothetical protein